MEEKNRKLLSLILFLISEIFAILSLVFLNTCDLHIHVLIMTFTTIILNGHGMVIFRIMAGFETYLVKYIHSAVEILALLGGVVGIVVMMGDNENGLSLHPYLGYFTLVLYVIQVIIAIFVYLYMYSNQRRRKLFAACHNFVGIAILQLSIVASCIQLQDTDEKSEGDFAVICLVLYGVMINSIVLNPYTEWRLVGPL